MSYIGSIDNLSNRVRQAVSEHLMPGEQVLLCFQDFGEASNFLERIEDAIPSIPLLSTNRKQVAQERGAIALLEHHLLIVEDKKRDSLSNILQAKYNVIRMAYRDINGIEIRDGAILGISGIFISTPNYPMPAEFSLVWPNSILFGKAGKQDALRFIGEIEKRVREAITPHAMPIQSHSQEIISGLQELVRLHEQGILTDNEFQKAKAKLLDS